MFNLCREYYSSEYRKSGTGSGISGGIRPDIAPYHLFIRFEICDKEARGQVVLMRTATKNERRKKMRQRLVATVLMATMLLSSGSAMATTLVDTLTKRFKKIEFPHDEVTAVIHLETKVNYLRGNTKEQDVMRSMLVQEKAVDTFKQNGWRMDDQLQTGVIDAGKIEFEVGEGMTLKFDQTLRLKAYVHQCDSPMHKFRGGDINEFFTKQVLEKAEECFTYDEKLQGKNWPY